MAQMSVKIGPEFFAGAFREYSNWKWALAREFMQNSIDAGADNIDINVVPGGADAQGKPTTVVTVENDGDTMSEDVLVNKLLTLGGSGKKFENGAVGGFGQAKHILYFCHESYDIWSGVHRARGAGADYDLSQCEHRAGTRSEIVIKDDHVNDLKIQFTLFARLCQWKGTIRLNCCTVDDGSEPDVMLVIPERTNKGARRKDVPYGTIYTNNSYSGLMLVRMGGIPMFTKPITHKGCVLVELAGTSADVLTSNRDGLVSEAQHELDEFLVSIATNARKAFKEPKRVEKKTYPGYKLAGRAVNQAAAKDQAEVGQDKAYVLAARVAATTEKQQAPDAPAIRVEQIEKLLRPEFKIRNELEGTIPEWFRPEGFSANSKRLISNWISLLLELAVLFECDKPFSVGFVFDDDCRALHEREGGESTIYVNPLTVVEKAGKPRQLKTYWSFDARGNWELLATAVHEFVHHLGYSGHDEDYAGKFTDAMALVLANRTRLSRHFSAPLCWPD